MTYVYVLTSTPEDLYYEQCLMSLYSLRLYMPTARAVVLTDDKTSATFTGKRDEIRRLASEVISTGFDDSVGNAERSRLIKTAIPHYIDDDFLYIDCDTVVCSPLEAITDCPYSVAGVLDGHVPLAEHIHKDYFLKRDKRLGFSGTKSLGANINGGVIFARRGDEARRFFDAWADAWKYSAYQKHDLHDQSALNEANFRMGLKLGLLSGEWNCQPANGGLAFLKDAKIIHYFSSEAAGSHYVPYYKLADVALQRRVKEAGAIPSDVAAMLASPKFQFNKAHLVNDARVIAVLQSPLLFTLAETKQKLPALFKVLEGACAFVRWCGKSLRGLIKRKHRSS